MPQHVTILLGVLRSAPRIVLAVGAIRRCRELLGSSGKQSTNEALFSACAANGPR